MKVTLRRKKITRYGKIIKYPPIKNMKGKICCIPPALLIGRRYGYVYHVSDCVSICLGLHIVSAPYNEFTGVRPSLGLGPHWVWDLTGFGSSLGLGPHWLWYLSLICSSGPFGVLRVVLFIANSTFTNWSIVSLVTLFLFLCDCYVFYYL